MKKIAGFVLLVSVCLLFVPFTLAQQESPEPIKLDKSKYLVVCGQYVSDPESKQAGWVYFLSQVDTFEELKAKYIGNVIYVLKLKDIHSVETDVEKVKQEVERLKFNGYKINKKGKK